MGDVLRSFRKVYTHCWTAETERLLKEHNKTGNPDVVQALIEPLDTERLKCWKALVKLVDFTHSSHKAWALIAEETGCHRKHCCCHPKSFH